MNSKEEGHELLWDRFAGLKWLGAALTVWPLQHPARQ